MVNLFTNKLFFNITGKSDLTFTYNMIISITCYLFSEITHKYDFKFTSNMVSLFTCNLIQRMWD